MYFRSDLMFLPARDTLEYKKTITTSITSIVKEKDPRRVAAGKRLGAISKQGKEAKRLERERQEQATRVNESGGYVVYLVGGLVVVGMLSYLGYLNKDKLIGSRDQRPTSVQPSPKKSQTTSSVRNKNGDAI